MKDLALHLRTLEDLEWTSIPGLVEVLREEGIDPVMYAVWGAIGWHRGYSSPAWRNQATAEQDRRGWETAVRIEKIICTVLHEAHERQIEETMATLSGRPDGFYG
jgi:hypothetical protein